MKRSCDIHDEAEIEELLQQGESSRRPAHDDYEWFGSFIERCRAGKWRSNISGKGWQGDQWHRLGGFNVYYAGSRLYWQRWLMLCILFGLSMLTDWTCFSLSSIMACTSGQCYPGFHVSNLVTYFLVANVISSLCEPAIAARIGLRNTILCGCALLVGGSLLRSGLPVTTVVNYTALKIGTCLVGAAQPFFQNTPSCLASAWFATDERTLALTISFNSPVVGVAFCFLVGNTMVTRPEQLSGYLMLLSGLALFFTLLAAVFFESGPPLPPSRSAHEKIKRMEDANAAELTHFFNQVYEAFRVAGFSQVVVAFVMTDCILNTIVTYLSTLLSPLGYDEFLVGVCGAGYEAALVLGSLAVGHCVDMTKNYHKATMACLSAIVVWLICLALDDRSLNPYLIITTFMLLGMCLGPIQPCLADLSVEVVYPVDDNAVLTVLQILGNIFASIAVPLFRVCRSRLILPDNSLTYDYSPSLYFLVALALIGVFSMGTFSAPLKRIETDLGKRPGSMDGYETLAASESDTDLDDGDLERRLDEEEASQDLALAGEVGSSRNKGGSSRNRAYEELKEPGPEHEGDQSVEDGTAVSL